MKYFSLKYNLLGLQEIQVCTKNDKCSQLSLSNLIPKNPHFQNSLPQIVRYMGLFDCNATVDMPTLCDCYLIAIVPFDLRGSYTAAHILFYTDRTEKTYCLKELFNRISIFISLPFLSSVRYDYRLGIGYFLYRLSNYLPP